MSKLINALRKENNKNLLGAIAFAAKNGGSFTTDTKVLNQIVDIYIKHTFIHKTKQPKTPHLTLRTQVCNTEKGGFYFTLNGKTAILNDMFDLERIYEIVYSRLHKNSNKIYVPKPISSTTHTKHLNELEKKFPKIDLFVKEELEPAIEKHKYVTVFAPVKTGKKIQKKFLGIRGQACGNTQYVVVSSLNRKDCKSQREEFRECNIGYLTFFNKKTQKISLSKIDDMIASGSTIVIMHDESDYGTDFRQIISKLFMKFVSEPKVHFVGFSATNEEMALSDDIEPQICVYIPPDNYCGASWYLNNSLCVEAEPFFDKDSPDYLSEQGREICDGWFKSSKDFVVVRFAAGFPEWVKDIKHLKDTINNSFDNKLTGIQIIDESNSWDWGEHGNWRQFTSTISSQEKQLLFICQTATRSVEWDKEFLRRLYASHDFRSDKAAYSAIIQALLRSAHFKDGDWDNDICPFLYGTLAALQLAAILEKEKDINKRREWCNSYSKKLGLRISSQIAHNEYVQVHFDSKPTEIEIHKACIMAKTTISGLNYKPKFRYVSTSNADDMADAILKNSVRSTDANDGIVVYSIDGPNKKYISSWEKLLNSNYKTGEFIAEIPINKKSVSTSDKSIYQHLN